MVVWSGRQIVQEMPGPEVGVYVACLKNSKLDSEVTVERSRARAVWDEGGGSQLS